MSVPPDEHRQERLSYRVNMQSKHRVVITGIGWITPMGHDIETVWQRLLAGASGIQSTSLFDASTFPTTFSAEVKDYQLERFVGEMSPHRWSGRNTAFGL